MNDSFPPIEQSNKWMNMVSYLQWQRSWLQSNWRKCNIFVFVWLLGYNSSLLHTDYLHQRKLDYSSLHIGRGWVGLMTPYYVVYSNASANIPFHNEWKQMRMLWKYSYVIFYTVYLNFLTLIFFYLIRMNTKVWYLPYFTRMIETFSNANARMVCMVSTMNDSNHANPLSFLLGLKQVSGFLHLVLYFLLPTSFRQFC